MYKKFYQFLTQTFVATDYWEKMRNTCEDSPWHRESSVASHTDMVISAFEDIQNERQFNETAAMLARFALLFHDVGKPAARTKKESAARGVYYSYPGHEQMSAREWENYYASHKRELSKEFNIGDWEAWAIGWMIEYHLPYDTKKPNKRSVMARTVREIERRTGGVGLFAAILRSDARGRISDDKLQKLEKVETWIGEFYALEEFAQ